MKEESIAIDLDGIRRGEENTFKQVFQGKANPSLKDIDGDTTLTFAMKNGHSEVATWLGEL